MSKKNKIIVIIILTPLALALLYGLFVSIRWFTLFTRLSMPTKQAAQQSLLDDKDVFVFIQHPYLNPENVSVGSAGKDAQEESPEMGNTDVSNAIRHLSDKYKNLTITPTADYIEFQLWATRDVSCGVVYSYTGTSPAIEFLTIMEPLNEPGWYYYVADVDGYKALHQKAADTPG